MHRRVGLIAGVAVLAALAVVAAAAARPATHQVSSAATASCSKGVQLGMLAPITGPAGSIGADQLHWAQFYVNRWNANKENKIKIKLSAGRHAARSVEGFDGRAVVRLELVDHGRDRTGR